MIDQQKKLKNKSDIEIKEYIGSIEIDMIEGKNRGLVATKMIKKGEVILVEKAFSTNEKR